MFLILASREIQNEILLSDKNVHVRSLKKKSRYLPHVKLFPLVKTPFTFDIDIPETQQQGIYRNYESHGHQIRFFFLFGNLIYDSHTPI
jgi:hypothetical protein